MSGPMTREEMEDTIAAVLCDYHPHGTRVKNDIVVLMRAMDEGIAYALNECADYLDSLPPGGEALKGPYWYRQGVHEGANQLRNVAENIADGQKPLRYAPTAKIRDGVKAAEQDVRRAQAAEPDWKTRALRAEAAVHHALWMSPLTYPTAETAEEMTNRFRKHIESRYPDLIVRHEHRRIEVFSWADFCGCDPKADDYDDDHCESGEAGEYICSNSFLGYVCDACEDETENGPAWKPEGVLWPCPPIAALDNSAEGGTR